MSVLLREASDAQLYLQAVWRHLPGEARLPTFLKACMLSSCCFRTDFPFGAAVCTVPPISCTSVLYTMICQGLSFFACVWGAPLWLQDHH